MARKRSDAESRNLALLAGTLLALPIALVGILHYWVWRRRYPADEASHRVEDPGRVPQILVTIAVVAFVDWYVVAIAINNAAPDIRWVIATLIIAPTVFYLSRWSASRLFGVLVQPRRDRLVLPVDVSAFGLADFVSLRFLRDFGALEALALSRVARLTRQSGTRLYLHGDFGSRTLRFSTKQRRDEVIYAIETAVGRRLVQAESGV